MQRLITDGDRAFILQALTGASDEVLVRAYQDWDAQRSAALDVRSKLGGLSAEEVVVAPSTERKNFSPGASSISRMSAGTKSDILSLLARGEQPGDKYSEHLKLLWERGDVKFDGEWYV